MQASDIEDKLVSSQLTRCPPFPPMMHNAKVSMTHSASINSLLIYFAAMHIISRATSRMACLLYVSFGIDLKAPSE